MIAFTFVTTAFPKASHYFIWASSSEPWICELKFHWGLVFGGCRNTAERPVRFFPRPGTRGCSAMAGPPGAGSRLRGRPVVSECTSQHWFYGRALHEKQSQMQCCNCILTEDQKSQLYPTHLWVIRLEEGPSKHLSKLHELLCVLQKTLVTVNGRKSRGSPYRGHERSSFRTLLVREEPHTVPPVPPTPLRFSQRWQWTHS